MHAILFPGQGAQYKGMGKKLFDKFPDHTQTANDILGYDITELCLLDPDDLLGQTQYTQPALYVVNALTYFDTPDAQDADYYLGHSLGEYNALLAAGAFDFQTGLELVQKRGALMAAASGGAMAAVLGIESNAIRSQLDAAGLTAVDLANYNTPTQTVISGKKTDIARAETMFAAQDIRCIRLNVSAPFHSRYMQSARDAFAEYLDQYDFDRPTKTVIANATAAPYDNAVAETLALQITASVRWVDSIRFVAHEKNVSFTEIGRRRILTKMVHTIINR